MKNICIRPFVEYIIIPSMPDNGIPNICVLRSKLKGVKYG